LAAEIGKRVRSVVAPRAAHWVPEENPAFVADALLELASARQ